MFMLFFTLYIAFCLVAIALWLYYMGLFGVNLHEEVMAVNEEKIFLFRFIACLLLVSVVILQ